MRNHIHRIQWWDFDLPHSTRRQLIRSLKCVHKRLRMRAITALRIGLRNVGDSVVQIVNFALTSIGENGMAQLLLLCRYEASAAIQQGCGHIYLTTADYAIHLGAVLAPIQIFNTIDRIRLPAIQLLERWLQNILILLQILKILLKVP